MASGPGPTLGEYLKEIPQEKLNAECTEEHLFMISQFKPIDFWETLAPILGVSETEVKTIARNSPQNAEKQAREILFKWKEKKGSDATYKKLCAAACYNKQMALVDYIRKLFGSEDSALDILDIDQLRVSQELDLSSETRPRTSESSSHMEATVNQDDQSSTAKILTNYANYLRGRYKTCMPSFFTLQWPPPPTRKVFNLAMVDSCSSQRGPINEPLVRSLITGDVGGFMKGKKEVKLEDLFTMIEGKREHSGHSGIILIEGAPGAGKSTWAWHLCQMWASQQCFCDLFQVVVFVPLRDPVVQEAESLTDILQARSAKERGEIMSVIEAHEGHGVLFVLDGWDEYSDGVFKEVIADAGKFNVHFSSFVITSRPISSRYVQQYANAYVEIVGFKPPEIHEYFSEALGNHETVQKLEEHLKERPIIEASCYLPLNAVIVAHLFQALGNVLPTTLHGVFFSLVCCCIVRHVAKTSNVKELEPEGVLELSSFDDIPLELQEPFKQLCMLAYYGVTKNKVVFSAKVMKTLNLPPKLNTLSLLQGVKSISLFNWSTSYNFLHLSVQELLAAYHISTFAQDEQIQIFRNLFNEPRFAAVFQFYAAFTKLQIQGIKEIVAEMIRFKPELLLSLLLCLFEAQDDFLCSFVAKELGRKFRRSFKMTCLHFLALGYFLSAVCRTTPGIFTVDLCITAAEMSLYPIHPAQGNDIIACISKELLSLQISENRFPGKLALVLKADQFNSDSFNQLSQYTHSLFLDGSTEDVRGMQEVAPIVEMNQGLLGEKCSIADLSLHDCRISMDGVESLAAILKTSNTLKSLQLSYCDLVGGFGCIAASLEYVSSLQILKLHGDSTLRHREVCLLAAAIKRNITIQRLNLANSPLFDAGISELAGALRRNCTIVELNVSDCRITREGALSLGSALNGNHTLEILDISNNRLYDKGICDLSRALRHNRSLKSLNITNCEHSIACLEPVGDFLQSNTSMQELKSKGVNLVMSSQLSEQQTLSHIREVLTAAKEAINRKRKRNSLPPLDLVITAGHIEYQSHIKTDFMSSQPSSASPGTPPNVQSKKPRRHKHRTSPSKQQQTHSTSQASPMPQPGPMKIPPISVDPVTDQLVCNQQAQDGLGVKGQIAKISVSPTSLPLHRPPPSGSHAANQQSSTLAQPAPDRSSNLILFGVKETLSPTETRELVGEVLEFVVGRPVDIRKMFRLGHKQPPSEASPTRSPRPILIKLASAWDRRLLLNSKHKLKEFRVSGLFLREDLSPEERLKRRNTPVPPPPVCGSSDPSVDAPAKDNSALN